MDLKGKLYCIVGPSGTGKSTLARSLKTHGIPECVSHTTRAPRGGEVNGVAYHFVSRDQFNYDLEAGQFIEHVEYNGNLYALSHMAVETALANGDACAVVEGHGAQQFKKIYPDNAKVLWLDPPPEEELRRRLILRGDSEVMREERLALRGGEVAHRLEHFAIFDYDIAPTPPDEMLADTIRIIDFNKGIYRDISGRVLRVGQEVVWPAQQNGTIVLRRGEIDGFNGPQVIVDPWHSRKKVALGNHRNICITMDVEEWE